MSEVSVPTAAELVERGLRYQDIDVACRCVQDALGVFEGDLAADMLGDDWRLDFAQYVVAERRGVLEQLMSEPVPVVAPTLNQVINQCNDLFKDSEFRMTKSFMGGGLRSGCVALNNGYLLINDYMMDDDKHDWAVGVWLHCDNEEEPIRWFEGDLRMALAHVEHFWIVREVLPGGSRA